MPPRLQMRFVSRRTALTQAAAAAAVLTLAACETEPEKGSVGIDTDPTDGIEPITPNDDFYVTTCCGTPPIDTASWTLTFRANGVEMATVDLLTLEAMEGRDREHTLQCIGASTANQAISNAVWTGLPLTEVLDALGVTVPDSAIEMKFTGADGYTTSLPVSDLDKPVWMVWRMNGDPLPEKHGTTVRLLVPGRYGMKNPKWITDLDFTDTPSLGFWESVGWSNTAEYQANTFVRTPDDNATVTAGTVDVLGTAYAGSDEITRVEISLDGGATWTDAELTYQNGPDVWTLWRYTWTVTEGVYRVQARCTTRSGAMSGGEFATGNLDGWDGSMVVDVEVVA